MYMYAVYSMNVCITGCTYGRMYVRLRQSMLANMPRLLLSILIDAAKSAYKEEGMTRHKYKQRRYWVNPFLRLQKQRGDFYFAVSHSKSMYMQCHCGGVTNM